MSHFPQTDNNRGSEIVNSAVVIPSLNPVPKLVDFVRELIERGIPRVIVVNDGSDSSYNGIFQAVAKFEQCTVLTHKLNRGKGRALKTAFAFCNQHFSRLDGVVTADADGQHAVDDICTIAGRLSCHEECLILGVRNFQENNVPKRSYMGNLTTSRIFWLLYGQFLKDTQTGLRGIPAKELGWMAEMKGERYDYEINMLIKAKFRHLNLLLIPIKTLYFDNNAGSHYKTVKDSARVFWCLISGLMQYFDKNDASSPGIKSRSRLNGFIFRASRFIIRCFTGRYQVCYTSKIVEPVVYIAHHQNLRGPVISIAWFDRPLRPWILSVFCEQNACFRQYYGYTFTKRFGLPKALAAVIVFPISFYIARLMQGMQGISVFRDSKAILKTFKISAATLNEGISLLICPDVDYTDKNENIGEMYLGFLNIEKYYYEQTGKHLAFVPVYISKHKRCIYVGKAVYFNTPDTFKQERAKVSERLKQEFKFLETQD